MEWLVVVFTVESVLSSSLGSSTLWHDILINWCRSSLALLLVTCGTPWDSPLGGTWLPHCGFIQRLDVEQITFLPAHPQLHCPQYIPLQVAWDCCSLLKSSEREFLKLYFVEVELIYNVVLISAVQKIHLVLIKYFSYFFHYVLSQDIECSSLCYTIGPILYTLVCIY